MSYPTKIEYATATWSPWYGCSKCSPGCANCFAETWAKRSGMVEWGPGKPRRKASPNAWREPLKWNRFNTLGGEPVGQFRVLTDLCDPFDWEVVHGWREDYFNLIQSAQNLTWLVLTKRITWCKTGARKLPENVWLGITVCNQEEADRDIPILLSIPATKHWISYEPALESITFRDEWLMSCDGCGNKGSSAYVGKENNLCQKACLKRGEGPSIDWIVAGCSSATRQQPAKEEWFRSARDQCQAAGIPFFLKQMVVGGKLLSMPPLDGKQWAQIPD